jgi:hypothetical protein
MSEMSAGAALRQLQQAQAGMRKARQAIRLTRAAGDRNAEAAQHVLRAGWETLARALRLMSEIPASAANEAVMTKQLAAQRYATALLVRLRRIARNEPGAWEGADDDDDGDEIS